MADKKYLNPSVSFSKIDREQYSSSDINMYFSNTYVLCDRGSFWQVGVFLSTQGSKGVVSFHDGGQEVLPFDKLYKFVMEIGFYVCGGWVISFQYPFSKSYKKSLSTSFISLPTLNGEVDCLYHELLNDIVTLPPEPVEGIKQLSRRIIACGDKIYQLRKNKTVGDFKEGTMSSIIPTLHDRIYAGGTL